MEVKGRQDAYSCPLLAGSGKMSMEPTILTRRSKTEKNTEIFFLLWLTDIRDEHLRLARDRLLESSTW